jgi:erythromycin esterase-like protein
MAHDAPTYGTLDEWIAREAIPFSLDSSATFNDAIERLTAALGGSVELLGLGEPLHGGEEFLILRNRLFERLVEAHGYTAIAVESSFPRAHLVNEYVAGRGPQSYEQVREAGFSHGFGRLEANRELVEWMRQYNANATEAVKLRFYGFDSPTEMTGSDSPRQLLCFVLDYLASIGADDPDRRRRITDHLGSDADWENPAAMMDPAQSVGLSPSAVALRIETEDLLTELQLRRPELAIGEAGQRYREAVRYTSAARELLNYHAALARPSDPTQRIIDALGIRDATMSENLAYVVSQERGRGKVLAFAHNGHLKLGKVQWQLGPHALTWWPAGAHLRALLGPKYQVIGAGLGASQACGIARPEPGTLEARLTASPGPARFIPTRGGEGLPAQEVTALPPRSTTNPSYFPLTERSFTDFDWLVVLDSAGYHRGGPPLRPSDSGTAEPNVKVK